MRKYFIITILICITATSCKKDRSEAREKKVLLTRTSTTYTSDGSTMITEYTYDNNGRIVTELEDKGTTNEQLITYTHDDKGNIAAQKFPNRGSLRTEYIYDNMNRMIASQKYATDGSKDTKRTYTYYEDRIEEVVTNKAGNSEKRLFTYTVDKQNIANFKMYYGNGNILLDQTYTYTNIKDPLRIVNPLTPYNGSTHLIEKTAVTDYNDPAKPATYNYTSRFVANANGYPTSVTEETSTGGVASTTTYEYIVK